MPKAPGSVGSGSGGATVLKRNQVQNFFSFIPKTLKIHVLGLPSMQKAQIGES
jgi:hypothetical protein